MMDPVKFPTLYGLTSRGEVKIWSIAVEEKMLHSHPVIVTTHGKLGGKMQIDTVEVPKGKNIGRENETTQHQQALLEAESKWTAKRDRELYSETQPTPGQKEIAKLPMLAKKFNEQGGKIVYPAFVQPKLNGVRCLAHVTGGGTHVKFISRKNVEYKGLDHIAEEVLKLSAGEDRIFDGELFNPDLSLQEIISRVKREKSTHEDVASIQYHIYDMADDRRPFVKRTEKLGDLFHILHSFQYLVRVLTYSVESEKDIRQNYHGEFIKDGYEGTMVRNASGMYKFNHRSVDLQKLKDFEEDEFEIVGGKTGVGREAGCILYICRTQEGREFTVRPKGSLDQRRLWLKKIKQDTGKDLTVRYLEMSADKIPQHPIGLAVRDYE